MSFEVHLTTLCLEAMIRDYLSQQGFPVEGKFIAVSVEHYNDASDQVETLFLEGIDVRVEEIPDEKAIASD